MRSKLGEDDRLPGLHLLDGLHGDVEHGLDDGAFAGQDSHFLVLIPEGGADAPRVADGEGLPASGQAADDVAPVPFFARCTQNVGQLDVVFYIMGDVHAGQSLGFGDAIEAFHLAVEAVSHLLQHDVGVGILARMMLPHGGYLGEYLVHVGQVEVAAEGQVLHPPVVAA